MQLTRDFLVSALHDALFKRGDVVLDRSNDVTWEAYEEANDVMVSIDSRTLQAGEFFIALKGPHFDGHDFILDVLKKKATGVLISSSYQEHLAILPSDLKQNVLFVIVPDTVAAFIALAKAWRARLKCPIVAITGSVGKTTTKEMTRSILNAAGIKAYVSFKNYNNIFGICYNMLRIPENVNAAVLEVGINEKGEMLQLADIVRPTIALITNIGHAHLEGLGNSLHAVSFEKRQLFAFFTPRDIGIVCGDQPLLSNISYQHPIAKFGTKIRNQVQARKITTSTDEHGTLFTTFTIKWYGKRASVKLQGNHRGFVNNALAASAIAYFLNVSFEAVIQGLDDYRGTEQRFEIRRLKNGSGLLLNDCYNANPESMKEALVAFVEFPGNAQKIAVLGDMLELGRRENYWHRQMGRVIAKVEGINRLILVGQRARFIGKTVPTYLALEYAQDWQEAQQLLERHLGGLEVLVLVKASHGMRLDQMVKLMVEE